MIQHRIAVFGYSAGGHLGAMLGTSDPDENAGLEGPNPRTPTKTSQVVSSVLSLAAPLANLPGSRATHCWGGWESSPEDCHQNFISRLHLISYVTRRGSAIRIIFHGSKDVVVPPKVIENVLYDELKKHRRIECHAITPSKAKGILPRSVIPTWLDQAIEFMDQQLDRVHYD